MHVNSWKPRIKIFWRFHNFAGLTLLLILAMCLRRLWRIHHRNIGKNSEKEETKSLYFYRGEEFLPLFSIYITFLSFSATFLSANLRIAPNDLPLLISSYISSINFASSLFRSSSLTFSRTVSAVIV